MSRRVLPFVTFVCAPPQVQLDGSSPPTKLGSAKLGPNGGVPNTNLNLGYLSLIRCPVGVGLLPIGSWA